MNEIRDLMIGIDFGEKFSQICYYDRKADEARSISMKVGSSHDKKITCLAAGAWLIGRTMFSI